MALFWSFGRWKEGVPAFALRGVASNQKRRIMPLLAVLAIVLLFIAALGQTWWWRGPAGTLWYGNAAFAWGVFVLALYLTWPTLKALGL